LLRLGTHLFVKVPRPGDSEGVLIYLSRYLDQETAKGLFRSSSQAATAATPVTTS